MKLAETKYDNLLTNCCAKLDPGQWENREWVWKEKPFLRDHMRAFFHVPLNFGAVMGRDQAAVERAEAWPPEPLWLTDEVSPWGSDLYVAVDRDVPGARIERISGRFITKIFAGPFHNVGLWIDEAKSFVVGRGLSVEKFYFYYATCPSCAKKLGANQVVVFAKVG